MSEKYLQSQLESALAECGRLHEENATLRRLLSEHGISLSAPPGMAAPAEGIKPENDPDVSQASSAEVKITLFRSFFRGREDVFAVRWKAPDGRTGYMPRADRDWKAYAASKPEDRKKVDRKTRKYWPLTDEVIRQHLTGTLTVGIYPLLLDETCWFLAVDFDKKSWQLDAAAFLEVSRKMAYLFRWNGPAQVMAATSGFSSIARVRQPRPGSWVVRS